MAPQEIDDGPGAYDDFDYVGAATATQATHEATIEGLRAELESTRKDFDALAEESRYWQEQARGLRAAALKEVSALGQEQDRQDYESLKAERDAARAEADQTAEDYQEVGALWGKAEDNLDDLERLYARVVDRADQAERARDDARLECQRLLELSRGAK